MLIWIFIAVIVLSLLYGVMIFNRIVNYKVECENAWGQIDVQLKRRHDLIPNLVETIKGIMDFEKNTLTQVMEARSKAMAAQSMDQRLKAEGEISGLLGKLMAVWENYPDLKSNTNARVLQEELITTENRISYSRGHFNDIVSNFNSLVQQFPSNLVATFGGFSQKEFFLASETERAAPQVKF